MESQTPVIPGLKEFEIIVGGPPHQPEYSPLHILVGTKPEVRYYARFKLTDLERAAIANGADILLGQLTFGNRYQPTNLWVAHADDMAAVAPEIVRELGIVLSPK
jgi:hypothetical protein